MNENKMDDQGWIKNKRCATGCTFYFVVSLPCAWYVLIEVKWSVTGTVTRLRVNVTLDILSSLGASLDTPLLLINTNQATHEWLIHLNWSITPDRSHTWMVESWIPSPIDIYERVRYKRTIPSTCMFDSHELMAESCIASLSDLNHLTLESLVSSSMDHCYGANSCLDRSNNQFLHSLFKEHEPWNRNFPTNNIELKRQGGRVLFPVRLFEISRSAPLT